MKGYKVMVDEKMKQMKETPTHVFLQGGVGGFPAATVSFFVESLDCPPIFVVVEPTNADCLFQSAVNGEPTVVHGDLDTVMAGRACGEARPAGGRRCGLGDPRQAEPRVALGAGGAGWPPPSGRPWGAQR